MLSCFLPGESLVTVCYNRWVFPFHMFFLLTLLRISPPAFQFDNKNEYYSDNQ